MNCRQLRLNLSRFPDMEVDIKSDGYDYFIQIHREDSLSLLLNNEGKRLRFKNLGEAEDTLRNLGIHRANLSHATAHDEMSYCGSITSSSQEAIMPLYF